MLLSNEAEGLGHMEDSRCLREEDDTEEEGGKEEDRGRAAGEAAARQFGWSNKSSE